MLLRQRATLPRKENRSPRKLSGTQKVSDNSSNEQTYRQDEPTQCRKVLGYQIGQWSNRPMSTVLFRDPVTNEWSSSYSNNELWTGLRLFAKRQKDRRYNTDKQQAAQLSLRDRATRCQLKSGKILHKCSTDCTWKGLQPGNEWPSRSLTLVPFDKPHKISY